MMLGAEGLTAQLVDWLTTGLAVECVRYPANRCTVPTLIRAQDRAQDEPVHNYPFVAVIVLNESASTWTGDETGAGAVTTWTIDYDVRIRMLCRNQGWDETDLERKRLAAAFRRLTLTKPGVVPGVRIDPASLRINFYETEERPSNGPVGRTIGGARAELRVTSQEQLERVRVARAGTITTTVTPLP